MYAQLVKYELRASGKYFLILGMILFFYMIFSLNPFASSAMMGTEFATGVILGAAVAVLALVTLGLLRIFSYNTYKEGGYFIMMLPVKTTVLAAAKLTAASIWLFLSLGGVLFCLIVLLSSGVSTMAGGIWPVLRGIIGVNHVQSVWMVLLYIAAVIVNGFFISCSAFFCCLVSRIEGIPKVAGVVVFWALGRISEFIVRTLPIEGDVNLLISNHDGSGLLIYLLVSTGISILLTAALFYGICQLLNKKLSLK